MWGAVDTCSAFAGAVVRPTTRKSRGRGCTPEPTLRARLITILRGSKVIVSNKIGRTINVGSSISDVPSLSFVTGGSRDPTAVVKVLP